MSSLCSRNFSYFWFAGEQDTDSQPVSYEDSDQSPLVGREARITSFMLSIGILHKLEQAATEQ
jgi:hypothetical protein